MRVVDLLCERLVDPIGLDARRPRLTWRLEVDAGERDVAQTAYEVEVGDWSTGRVESWRQQVTYEGPALSSRHVVQWRVRVWTSARESDWSGWASFEVGLLHESDWSAQMITADKGVVRFATTIDVPDDVVAARLRLTAHGVVYASIGGVEVGGELLAPGWTSYDNRLIVRTHDVTKLVRGDRLEVAATVGPGWFSGRIGFRDAGPLYGTHVGVLLQLETQCADGSLVVVGTDESWTATTTEYALGEIYDGEDIDHSLRGDPLAVHLVDSPPLCAPAVPPVRRTEFLKPVSVSGSILDFGQNLVGWLRLRFKGVPAGTLVTMRHAEILDNDGALFTAPLRTARATDNYVVGDGNETYEPRFTFHGFRYAEITGVDLESVEVEAVVIHSDLVRIGEFECSDPLLNRLHDNVVWGWRGNSVAVPTDCPQRDERLGWTGDAQVFAPTASFLYDAETFWENWLADLAADQRDNGAVPSVVPDIGLDIVGACGWGDAAVIVPWTTYVAYGDDTVLRTALPSMRASVDYVYSRLDEEHRWLQDFQYGDWVDPDAPTEQPWRAKAKFDLVATAYAARVADLLARAAAIVGDEALATQSRDRFDTVRAAWWQHYGEAAATTQTGAALAIAFDLVPDDEARFKMGEALALRVHDADDHLSTGFLGTPLLLPALTATGHLDVAYAVLLQRSAPSWLYTVLAGGTTIWERWDALRPDGSVALESLGGGSEGSMVSFNHYAFGAVAEWLHTAVAGLRPDPDDPGYHHFFVEPRPGGGLTHASASLQTRYGRASVAWRLAGDKLHVDVEVPPNTTATVSLPGSDPRVVGSGFHAFS